MNIEFEITRVCVIQTYERKCHLITTNGKFRVCPYSFIPKHLLCGQKLVCHLCHQLYPSLKEKLFKYNKLLAFVVRKMGTRAVQNIACMSWLLLYYYFKSLVYSFCFTAAVLIHFKIFWLCGIHYIYGLFFGKTGRWQWRSLNYSAMYCRISY